jgi:hypothetical protein
MRWLPRLISHAAAAGRASAARTTSHVRVGSHGFGSGGGGGDGLAVPREWLRKLWAEELRKQKEAAKRWGIGGTGDSLGVLASSEEPALQDGRVIARERLTRRRREPTSTTTGASNPSRQVDSRDSNCTFSFCCSVPFS